MDVQEPVEPAEHMETERSDAVIEAGDTPAAMPESVMIEALATDGRRARHPLRATALAVLVVCLLIAGAGSVVLTSRANRPSVPARLLSPDIVLEQANAPSYPTPAPQHTVTVLSNPGKSHSQTQQLAPQAPSGAGQVIVVSLSKQQLWAYQNGQVVYTTLVVTGRPELPTPVGTFSIYNKVYDTEFISPWPPGSPYYYSPEHVNYAMEFLTGGYYIHDAPWRSDFGPGDNVPHTGPDGTQETGSHGCVEVPTPAGAWLYNWAGYGATVQIVP